MNNQFNFYVLLIIVIVIVLIAIIFALRNFIRKIKGFFRRQEMYGLSRENIKRKWKEIEELLNRGDEMSYKIAVVEADKLMDHALKSMAISGKDFGERLKLINYKYQETKQAWFGHKIRNRLVHEADFHLDYRTAKQAINSFKNALISLGLL